MIVPGESPFLAETDHPEGTLVRPWVRELVEGCFGPSPFKIGDTVKHPDGRTVRITDGQYWGTHGISNFWYWREVLSDGSLGEVEHGYGWRVNENPSADNSG